MKLLVFKSFWGMTGTLDEKLARIAAAKYDGVEATRWDVGPSSAEFLRKLARHKLKLVGMAFTEGPDHVASLAEQLRYWKPFKPLSVTAHSATDAMPFADQVRFFHEAARAEEALGLPVAHETHRGRAMFTPWNTAAILKAVPGVGLCADFSHWCCVAESLLERNQADVDLAIARTRHVHARVGYAEGPQVPDPRAPEWAAALARHEGWWKAILAQRKKSGAKVATLTPEFGPPDYLHTLPYTRQPVADLWEVCLWMAGRLRKESRA